MAKDRNLGPDAPDDELQATGSSGSAAANANSSIGNVEDAKDRAESAQAARDLRMAAVDPVTNQRAADFFPDNAGLEQREVDLILDNRRASGVSGRVSALQGAARAKEAGAAGLARAEEARAQVEHDNPIPDEALVNMALDPATYRARVYARNHALAQVLGTSTTIPGGRFTVNGQLVNAHGDVIDDEGNVLQKRS